MSTEIPSPSVDKREGRKLTPFTAEHRAKISASLKDRWASGAFTSNREKASKTMLALHKNGLVKKVAHEVRVAAGRAGGLANQRDPERRANSTSRLRALAANQRGQKNPPGRSEAGENNCRAKWWNIRNPAGESISGKNLNEIVRRHAHLFEPEDVVWKRHKCRAANGIRYLGCAAGHSYSWKGWTLIGSAEVSDLTARNIISPNQP